VTNRRPPPGDSPDATALLEWPGISRSDGGDTDPTRRRLIEAVGDATGRHSLEDLDDLRPSELPSAWVSEFEVSDLDGDVVGPGAATTIMQLPPEMLGHDDVCSAEETAERDAVELLKWRAGPAGGALPPAPTDTSRDLGDGTAATLPALSLDLVQAAVAAAPGPATSQPAHGIIDDDDDDEDTQGGLVVGTADRLRATLEEAMAALLAAQSCADDGEVPEELNGHLARAVQLLSSAQDLGDEL
jgi:hypothetical protein